MNSNGLSVKALLTVLVLIFLPLLLSIFSLTILHEMGHLVTGYLINPQAIEEINLINFHAILNLIPKLIENPLSGVIGGHIGFSGPTFSVLGIPGAHIVGSAGILTELLLFVGVVQIRKIIDWSKHSLALLTAFFSFEAGFARMMTSWIKDFIGIVGQWKIISGFGSYLVWIAVPLAVAISLSIFWIWFKEVRKVWSMIDEKVELIKERDGSLNVNNLFRSND